jgi:hypothetical protein
MVSKEENRGVGCSKVVDVTVDVELEEGSFDLCCEFDVGPLA